MNDDSKFIMNFGATMYAVAAIGVAVIAVGTMAVIGGGMAIAKFILK